MTQVAGVDFPEADGRRSTTAVGRAIVADALRPVDPIGANAAARESNWRAAYLPHFHRLVEASLVSPQAALEIADAGLTSVHERMRWVDADGDHPLAQGLTTVRPAATEAVQGQGQPEWELTVPFRGSRLSGDALKGQLRAWVDAGVMEPSAEVAVSQVIDHPEWLSLAGRTVVVLGAAAEMGPLRALLRWGATVAAVDLPRADPWSRVLSAVDGTAGRLLIPVQDRVGSLSERAGIDLVHDLPGATAWVGSLEGPLVIGNYVYADGAANVRVATAVDALGEALRATRAPGEVALSFLATPTDVFAVPGEAVAASAAAYASRRTSKVLRGPLGTLSGGRLLRRNYVPGQVPGINDSVVLQQGPNYLLAKRIQRWRATVARAAGMPVSFTVAPPTRTRSVVKNRALAAAYAGAHRFGMEVFEPGTANTLMAALLVHDLSATMTSAAHPWEDEANHAVHGGLWRAAYDPRSVLGLAAVMGAMSRH